MSSRDDDNTGLAAVGGVLAMAGLFLFAVLAFIALIFTILALIALFIRPIRIGSFAMSAEQAERFLFWSVVGAIILPVFSLFCEWFFDFQIRDKLWFYIVVGGYVLGWIAMELHDEEEQKKQQQAAALRPRPIPPAPQRPSPPRGLPRPQAEIFRFARWDDEERRK